MSHSTLRRKVAVLLLATAFVAAAASAAGLPWLDAAPPVPASLLERALCLFQGLLGKAGCGIDPDGLKEGCGIDPSGLKAGCGIDPSGPPLPSPTALSAPAGQGEEGCLIDPSGHCIR